MIVGGSIALGGLIKLAMPTARLQKEMAKKLTFGLRLWCTYNGLILKLLSKTDIKVYGLKNLDPQKSYFLFSNHQSGFDIAMIGYIFRKAIPTPKYFLKKELFYIPFLGFACWALDMPFLHRKKAKDIKKNRPQRRIDLAVTQKACQKFQGVPTSIINFVEGTRVTKTKIKKQNSPYKHLIKPKAGGMALSLALLGQQFDKILNITIIYPEAEAISKPILTAVLCGEISKVIVHIEQLPVPHINYESYQTHASERIQFQKWLNELWYKKDNLIIQAVEQHQESKNLTSSEQLNVPIK
jgi:1-acyl-sn-glycerol-3-phosphate acyltransferase